ncbi:HNH endonuclease [Brevibacillus sp. AG]|uniref:HNH endonuclease n=1 Tax=Brevibacillus sp. AG TaxID=3020891 RepID=UPI002330C671|nr:HNH endonuclease [Brevibacillus sp. AG]MDC0764917.1 HNH endonuclease [Brevibacillus sp. AG]
MGRIEYQSRDIILEGIYLFENVSVKFKNGEIIFRNEEANMINHILNLIRNVSEYELNSIVLQLGIQQSFRDGKELLNMPLKQSFIEDLQVRINDILDQKNQTISTSLTNDILKKGKIVPETKTRILEVIQRNRQIVKHLKQLYNNCCQICQERIDLGFGEYMSHVHHIKPLGSKHQGPDIIENMILLCPNHHSMFDAGSITFDLDSLEVLHVNKAHHYNLKRKRIVLKHEINNEYIKYHNKYILKKDYTK